MTIIDLADAPEHLLTLARWHHAEWSHLYPHSTLVERVERMQSYLTADFIPSTYLYKHEQALAGSAALVRHDMDTHPELSPWLASVYVTPGMRRRGIGTQLVRHTMTMARQHDIDTLYLFTPDQVQFYQRLGWETIAEELYCGATVTIMRIKLRQTDLSG